MIVTDSTDKEIIKQHWKRIFGDSDVFLDELFSLVPMIFGLKISGKIASSLLVIEMDYKEHKVAYIYGAMTFEKFRRQGLMRRLLDEVCDFYENKGFSALFLLPANEKLYNFYAGCGFEKKLPVDTVILNELPQGTEDKVLSREEYERLDYPVKMDYALFEFAIRTHLLNGGHTVNKNNDFIAYHINDGQVICDMACTENIIRDRLAMSKCFNGFKWGKDAHIGLLME